MRNVFIFCLYTMKNVHTLGILAAVLLLSGCTSLREQNMNQNMSNTNASSVSVDDAIGYRNTEFNFSLILPKDMVASTDAVNYLLPDSWSALDDGTGSGAKLATFIVDGSNPIIAAGIRIGTSRGQEELKRCLSGPDYATSVIRTQEINGKYF